MAININKVQTDMLSKTLEAIVETNSAPYTTGRTVSDFVIFVIFYLVFWRISPQCRHIVQTWLPLISSFFLCCYLFSLYCQLSILWNIYFFILAFSDPILFSLFLFLCSTFRVFYFLSFSSVFLCISSTSTFSFSISVSSTFFHAAFYLSPLTFFVYHLLFLSVSISFFVFYYPSWLSSTFFLCLYCVMFPLLFSLSLCMCFIIIIIIIELLIYIELIIYIIINTQKNYTGKYFWNRATTSNLTFQEPFSVF